MTLLVIGIDGGTRNVIDALPLTGAMLTRCSGRVLAGNLVNRAGGAPKVATPRAYPQPDRIVRRRHPTTGSITDIGPAEGGERS